MKFKGKSKKKIQQPPTKWGRRKYTTRQKNEDPYFIDKEKRILEHMKRIQGAKNEGLL
jgi:hypothetical protein